MLSFETSHRRRVLYLGTYLFIDSQLQTRIRSIPRFKQKREEKKRKKERRQIVNKGDINTSRLQRHSFDVIPVSIKNDIL